jgi:hypothetical protein
MPSKPPVLGFFVNEGSTARRLHCSLHGLLCPALLVQSMHLTLSHDVMTTLHHATGVRFTSTLPVAPRTLQTTAHPVPSHDSSLIIQVAASFGHIEAKSVPFPR